MGVRQKQIRARAQGCGGELLEAIRLIRRHALNEDLIQKARLELILDLSTAVIDKIEDRCP